MIYRLYRSYDVLPASIPGHALNDEGWAGSAVAAEFHIGPSSDVGLAICLIHTDTLKRVDVVASRYGIVSYKHCCPSSRTAKNQH